jgi:sirohydrochlorin ferrochelatase
MLLGVAHGTRNPAGAQVVQELLDRVRALRPWLEVGEAYAEIAAPSVADAVEPGAPVVAVPLLLGRGYHAEIDIPRQLVEAGADAVVSQPLGPHSLLGAALVDRLGAGRDCDAVVLGGAGSTSPAGVADAKVAARLLSRRLQRPVTYGFVGGPSPQLGEVVGRLREQGAKSIAIASYLLAPGFFHGRMELAGADFVSPPLGAHDAVAKLVLRRFDEAVIGARVAVGA